MAEATGIDFLRRFHAGASCRLVPLHVDHSQVVVDWRNDPGNARYFLSTQRFTVEGHERWLERALASDREMNWVICKAGRAVGTVSLYGIDWDLGSAEFGRLLLGDPTMRGTGVGREATRMVLDLAGRAGLSNVYLDVRSENVVARGLYQSLGFKPVETSEETVRMVYDFVD